MNRISTSVIIFLSACAPRVEIAPSNGTPIVRADGAAATLTIVACPTSDARAQGLGELIRELLAQDEMVVARNGGSARLTINVCPAGVPARR